MVAKTPRKRGNRILKKAPEIPLFKDEKALPPLLCPYKNTVFLDLDETLDHASHDDPSPAKFDFVVNPVLYGKPAEYFLLKRPFMDEFLESLSKKFEIVVFTSGIKDYACPILDMLDKKGLISHRLYSDSCKKVGEKHVKDLSELGRDLKRVVIVDDNPEAYALQPENAIPIRSFKYDSDDVELKRVMEFF